MWKFLVLLAVASVASERPAFVNRISSGSPSRNPAYSANYLQKRRCREVYGDDFEKKWDCIRSGTLPTPRATPVTTRVSRPTLPIGGDDNGPSTERSTSKPTPKPYWNGPGDNDGDDHHGGDHQRPPTRRPTGKPVNLGWHGSDDDDDHHNGGQHQRPTTRRPSNSGWHGSEDDDHHNHFNGEHHSNEHHSNEFQNHGWST